MRDYIVLGKIHVNTAPAEAAGNSSFILVK